MRSEASLNLDRETFRGQMLSIGFLGATGREAVESISLEVSGGETPLVSFLFGDLDAAIAALTDAYVGLGTLGAGEEDFFLSIVLEMTFSGKKADFGTTLLPTAVPEPGAAILMGVVLLAWARSRRRG